MPPTLIVLLNQARLRCIQRLKKKKKKEKKVNSSRAISFKNTQSLITAEATTGSFRLSLWTCTGACFHIVTLFIGISIHQSLIYYYVL